MKPLTYADRLPKLFLCVGVNVGWPLAAFASGVFVLKSWLLRNVASDDERFEGADRFGCGVGRRPLQTPSEER